MLFRDSQKLSNFCQTFVKLSAILVSNTTRVCPTSFPSREGCPEGGVGYPVFPIPRSLFPVPSSEVPCSLFPIPLTKSLHRQRPRLLPRLLQLSVNLSQLPILLRQHRLQRLQFHLIALFVSLPSLLKQLPTAA